MRAAVLDIVSAGRWPNTLGTRVYLLANSIMNIKKERQFSPRQNVVSLE